MVGRCWHQTHDGKCPRHGDVSAYLARLPKLTDENEMLRDRGQPELHPTAFGLAWSMRAIKRGEP